MCLVPIVLSDFALTLSSESFALAFSFSLTAMQSMLLHKTEKGIKGGKTNWARTLWKVLRLLLQWLSSLFLMAACKAATSFTFCKIFCSSSWKNEVQSSDAALSVPLGAVSLLVTTAGSPAFGTRFSFQFLYWLGV